MRLMMPRGTSLSDGCMAYLIEESPELTERKIVSRIQFFSKANKSGVVAQLYYSECTTHAVMNFFFEELHLI